MRTTKLTYLFKTSDATMLQGPRSHLLNDLYGGGSCRSLKVKSVVGYMQCDHIGHFLKVPGDKTFKK